MTANIVAPSTALVATRQCLELLSAPFVSGICHRLPLRPRRSEPTALQAGYSSHISPPPHPSLKTLSMPSNGMGSTLRNMNMDTEGTTKSTDSKTSPSFHQMHVSSPKVPSRPLLSAPFLWALARPLNFHIVPNTPAPYFEARQPFLIRQPRCLSSSLTLFVLILPFHFPVNAPHPISMGVI